MAHSNRFANMRGFATDYFVSLRAAEITGGFLTGYVSSNQNKFYGGKDETDEFQGVTKFISEQTAALGKTRVAENIRHGLRDRSVENIAEFYDRPDVEYVRDLMVEALG